MKTVRAATLVVLTLGLAHCGGGGSSSTPSSATIPAGFVRGTLAITLTPRYDTASAKTRTPQFASPAAVSLAWSVNGGATAFADVSSTSSACTTAHNARTCNISISAPAGNDSFTVSLYDAANGAGNFLGSGSNSGNVTAAGFNVSVGINPVVAGVVSQTLTWSNGSHTFPVGQQMTATVAFTFSDPDGQAIPPLTNTPNFLNPVTLTSSDPHITFSPSSLTTPGQTATLTYDGSTNVQQNPTVTLAQSTKTVAVVPLNGGQSSFPLGCTSTGSLPGTYRGFFASGTLTGSTFTMTGSGSWFQDSYVAAAPSPSPTYSPNASPAPSSSPFSLTAYIGTYSLVNGTTPDTTGCFVLFSYTSGGTTLIAAAGAPYFGDASYTVTLPTGSGPFFGSITALTVNNLSASGGSGTLALDNGETGTITISQQFTYSQAQLRQMLGAGLRAFPSGRLPF